MGKLIVKIAEDGQLTIEGEGFKGSACLEKSKKLIEGLGKLEKQTKKNEFYEQPEVTIENSW